MRHMRPPPGRAGPADAGARAVPARIGAMVNAADDLWLSLAEGGSGASDRLARVLLEELRALVPELARARGCSQSVARITLFGLADRLAQGIAECAAWRGGPRTASESLVRALVARLRLVANN